MNDQQDALVKVRKIKDLLAKDLLKASTRLVLVNAIYFKGKWNEQFKEEFTVDAPFRINKNDTKPVKMMRIKSKFTLISIPEVKCQILEMPYEGKDLSMLFFLPNDIEDETTGLEQLKKELTYENFVEWTRLDLAGQSEIEVRLPRFKMEEKYDLKEVLISMGMEDAFDVAKSDFSDMMASPNPLSKANIAFSLDLFKKLSEDKTGNIFFSPFSISSALAMVMLGTRGNTATQMSECLKTQDLQDDVHSSFSQLLSEFNKPDAPCVLSVANRLYGEQSFQFVMDYLTKTRTLYKAELEPVDFITGFEEARININSWVEKQTQGKIKDVVAKEMVDEMTRLVLVNALYFKGSWNKPFFEMSTYDDEFKIDKCLKTQDLQDDVHSSFSQLLSEFNKPDAPCVLSDANRLYGEQSFQFVMFAMLARTMRKCSQYWFVEHQIQAEIKPVKMMFEKSGFPYAFIPEANCQILEMPYKGKELSMLIFLPNELEHSTTGLKKLERLLTSEKFVQWTHPEIMNVVEVEVRVPRFKMEEMYDLNDVLKSMGVVDAFDSSTSDFSGMSETRELRLSKVAHKAFVEVNEEGTEAAAGTACLFENLCYIFPEASFTADHPFLFFIRHNPTMTILFAGRFYSPV